MTSQAFWGNVVRIGLKSQVFHDSMSIINVVVAVIVVVMVVVVIVVVVVEGKSKHLTDLRS